jgi:hypothetical protein
MPRCKKGNTFPDEGWHDGDDELVNRGLIQEGPDDLTSAHHPDVLADLSAEAFGKGTDRLGDEVDARGHGSRRRLPREHIVHGICTEMRAHLQTPVEGLAAEDLGIGGALEFRETVEALWSWPFRQPIEIAIGSSHEAVRARRKIDDDFSLWHSTPMSVSNSAGERLERPWAHPYETGRMWRVHLRRYDNILKRLLNSTSAHSISSFCNGDEQTGSDTWRVGIEGHSCRDYCLDARGFSEWNWMKTSDSVSTGLPSISVG